MRCGKQKIKAPNFIIKSLAASGSQTMAYCIDMRLPGARCGPNALLFAPLVKDGPAETGNSTDAANDGILSSAIDSVLDKEAASNSGQDVANNSGNNR